MKMIEYADREMMMIDLANLLTGELAVALKHADRVSVAVPGGSTPGPMYDGLCAADLDWDRVDIVLTDERWVPESSARSNTRLLRERLLVGRAAKARLIPLFSPGGTPEEHLPGLRKTLGPSLPLDILLLGMGPDMHTASLFADAVGLAEAFDAHAPLILRMRLMEQGETRVTLSAPVLQGATTTHVLITGRQKRKALHSARDIDDPMRAPISAFLQGATVHWAP
ncbi:MAG: 6-phosphogluconolactonase [Halocynthiibacter sp.]